MKKIQFGWNEFKTERCHCKDITISRQKKERISVPLASHYHTITEDVPAETNKNKGERYLDSGQPPSSMQSFKTKHYETWSMMKLTRTLFLSSAGTNIGLNHPQITRSIHL
jgi:hypothetical protein